MGRAPIAAGLKKGRHRSRVEEGKSPNPRWVAARPIAAWFEDGEMKKNLRIGTGALAGDWSLDGRRTGILSTVRTVASSNQSWGAHWTAAALHGCRTGNPISLSWHRIRAAALAGRPPHFISVGQGIPSRRLGIESELRHSLDGRRTSSLSDRESR
jgi:hypothetical protein